MNIRQIVLMVLISIITSLVSQGYLTNNQAKLIEDIATKVLIENVVTGSLITGEVSTGLVIMYESEITGEYIGVE